MYRHTHKYAYINIAILATIALVYFFSAGNTAQSVIAQASSSPMYRASTAEGGVALVSWYDSEPQLLEKCAQAADSAGIKLNVFVTAEYLYTNKDGMVYALQNGHIAGIYGNDIPKDTPADEISSAMQQSSADFERLYAATSFYMPNNGEHTRRLGSCASKAGLNVVLWSKDSRAYVCATPEDFAAEVVNNADNGDFILVRLDERLCSALPAIAGGIAAKGLRPASLNDLLNGEPHV